MATEHDLNHDLYSYDGYEKAMPDLPSNSEARQPRQDSGVDFQTIHNNAVGTLFAPRAAADIASMPGPLITPSQAVDAGTQRRSGTEASIFARYETHTGRIREDADQTINELRTWLKKFKLPQVALANDQADVVVDREASPRPYRKRSLSVQTANAVASQVPRLRSAGGSIDGADPTPHEPANDDIETFTTNERLDLLLLDALPMLPLEMTCEWNERQRAREDYDSIDRARIIRLRFEDQLAQARATNLAIAVNRWADAEEDRKRAESYWSEHEPSSNLAEYASPGGLQSWLERSVIQDLQDIDDLMDDMSDIMNYTDSSRYIVPPNWDMTDRPRRTRIYSNIYYFLRYMTREKRVFTLIDTRLEFLREGLSTQSEAAIAREIEHLERIADLRTVAERDYYDLTCDFLNWTIAHTTLEFQDMANGGSNSTRPNALTHDLPLDLVADVIEYDEGTGLKEQYERLRALEKAYVKADRILSYLPRILT